MDSSADCIESLRKCPALTASRIGSTVVLAVSVPAVALGLLAAMTPFSPKMVSRAILPLSPTESIATDNIGGGHAQIAERRHEPDQCRPTRTLA